MCNRRVLSGIRAGCDRRIVQPWLIGDLARFGPVRLWLLRLEKRSQALQACNLTRNIQADGAPMVHRTPVGFCLQGFFFAIIGHRSYAFKNAFGNTRSSRSFPPNLRVLATARS